MDVPGGIYAHIAGVDIVRAGAGRVLRARGQPARALRRVVHAREPQDDDAAVSRALRHAARSGRSSTIRTCCSRTSARRRARRARSGPTVAVLTPGAYNSAYFEHAFLAQQMGVELVEGQDLFVQNDTVYMRTTRGPQRVHVIYRRVDDDFLDPLAFRPDSMLGVPGPLRRVSRGPRHARQRHRHRRRRRQVDLSVRAGHDPLLPVRGADPPQRADVHAATSRRTCDYVLAHLPELVVKEVHGAGGYGMLIGPGGDRRGARGVPRAHPRRLPTSTSRSRRSRCRRARRSSRAGIAPRHIDLRPYVLSGTDSRPRARRPHARRAARRVAGRQLVAGRRHQGHLGARMSVRPHASRGAR